MVFPVKMNSLRIVFPEQIKSVDKVVTSSE